MLFYDSIFLDDVKRMASQGLVVLSPHLDDACFSIGCLLSSLGQGNLINVFSRSLYAPGLHLPELTEQQVHAVRSEEDAAFADRVGLKRTQLGGSEPNFWGRRPNDLSGLSHDVECMEEVLVQGLERYALNGKRPLLLVPLATGHHVNHHAVYQIVRKHANELGRAFRLGFYEDLPYAHVPATRYFAIRRFKADFPAFDRHAFALSWADKKSLIGIYGSQLRRPPHPLKFRPAVGWPLGVHEAIWFNPADFELRGAP